MIASILGRIVFSRRKILISATVPVLLGGVLTLPAGFGATVASPKPHRGGSLTFLTHLPKFNHFDVAQIDTSFEDFIFLNSFITRTLEYDSSVPATSGSTIITNTQLVPDLATNTGVVSNDAKTWQFTLRAGSKFEDGNSITCADVKYGVSRGFAAGVINGWEMGTLRQWLDIPKDKDGNSTYLGPYKSDAVGQAAFDKAVTCDATNRTITFKLNTPVADFNGLASTGAMAPVEKSSDSDPAAYDLHPQATGPYKIESNSNDSLILVRNANWSQASDPVRGAYPDRIGVIFGLDSQLVDQIMAKDLVPNAINYDNPLPENRSKFYDATTGQPLPSMASRAVNYANQYTYYLAFNIKKMPCLEVREAMYYARDAQANLNAIGGTAFGGSYATGIISPSIMTDYAPTGIAGPGSPDFIPSGNIAKAKALLEVAKTKCPAEYTHATQTGIIIDIGQGQEAKQDSIDNNVVAYARAGIKVSYNAISQGDYYLSVLDRGIQNDLSWAGWGADWGNASTDIPTLYTTTSPTNPNFDLSRNEDDPNYPAFAIAVAQAMTITDRQQQATKWKELDKQAMSYFWVLPTNFGKAQFVWGSGLGGVSLWAPQGALSFSNVWVK